MMKRVKPIFIVTAVVGTIIIGGLAVLYRIGREIEKADAGVRMANTNELSSYVGIDFPRDAVIVDGLQHTSLQAIEVVAVVSFPSREVDSFLKQTELSLYRGTEQIETGWTADANGVRTAITQPTTVNKANIARAPAELELKVGHWGVAQARTYKMAGWGSNHLPPQLGGRTGRLLVQLDDPKTATVYLAYFD